MTSRPRLLLQAGRRQVEATTVVQVNQAIKQYMDPTRLVQVKAGTFAKP